MGYRRRSDPASFGIFVISRGSTPTRVSGAAASASICGSVPHGWSPQWPSICSATRTSSSLRIPESLSRPATIDLTNAPTLVAPNGIDRTLYDDLAPVAAAEPDGEPIRVTYAGALGYFQALGSLLETAAMMPDVEFTFVGDGTERDHLESDARDLGLTNVRFTGYVERSRLFDLYRESDILFAQLRELDVMAQATFPSKVFEYLATGRPVVYAGAGITADFLHGTGAALIAEPEDPESIRQAIAKLQGDRGAPAGDGRERAQCCG